MQRPDWKIVLKLAVALSFVVGVAARSEPQSRRQVKVLVESQQSGTQNQEAVQGSGSVIIGRGNVSPSGRVTARRQTDDSTALYRHFHTGAGWRRVDSFGRYPSALQPNCLLLQLRPGSWLYPEANRVHQCRNIASCQCQRSSRQPDQSPLDSEDKLLFR